jgi:serine/threonine protein kinase
MTPERWKQIEQLCNAALERDANQRAAFLLQACGGDDELRREVESLLAQEKPADRFLESSDAGRAVEKMVMGRGDGAKKLIGKRLGSYQIVSLLGAGGMGEVYRARDTRLDRTVAIKILPERLADRTDLRERFEREARTIASLNHPHICTLYDVGREGGTDYLVMEFVDGETLAERLKKGPLPLDQVLRYAIEVADALDKAHRKGITHRDLKPGNIMLTKSGAKLLDFGLAKLRLRSDSGAPLSELPTEKSEVTATGTILGTLQYMAPEQLEGKEADARTDIFAFGAVLYEMAAGKKAFEGKSQASLIAKILETDPAPISTLQPMTPPTLDHLVKRCLGKEPDERWQSTKDICEQLRWISDSRQQTDPPALVGVVAQQRRVKKRLFWAGMVVAALAAARLVLFLYPHFRQPTPEVRTIRFTVSAPTGQDFPVLGNTPSFLSVSPDGSKLTFVAVDSKNHSMLWLRDLGSQTAQPLPGTDGALAPFWSPDSRFIAFSDNTSLKRIAVAGGPAQTIAASPALGGGTWNRDGLILFAASTFGGPILRVSAAGGSATPMAIRFDTPGTQMGYAWPTFLPDGRHFLYLARGEVTTSGSIYAGSLDSKEAKLLLKTNSAALYSPPGYLLYVRAGTLLAQPFDADRLELRGEAVPIAESLQFSPLNGRAGVAVSDNGVLAYRSVPPTGQLRFVLADRKGAEQALAAPPHAYRNPRLSPDGQRVAVTIDEGGSQEWVLDIARGTLSRLTFECSYNGGTAWTPDGKRVTFGSDRAGTRNLFWQLADGSGGAERLVISNHTQVAGFWSPDGRTLAFEETGAGTGYDIWTFRLGDQMAQPFLQTRFNEIAPRFSPDGHWLAYASDESGRYEIYVQPYPGPGGKWQISTEGGTEPIWTRNGELFYRNGEKLMVVQATTRPSFSAGNPKVLFEGRYATYQSIADYDVTADGQRFLFLKTGEEGRQEINVVVNWTEELKQKIPQGKN